MQIVIYNDTCDYFMFRKCVKSSIQYRKYKCIFIYLQEKWRLVSISTQACSLCTVSNDDDTTDFKLRFKLI